MPQNPWDQWWILSFPETSIEIPHYPLCLNSPRRVCIYYAYAGIRFRTCFERHAFHHSQSLKWSYSLHFLLCFQCEFSIINLIGTGCLIYPFNPLEAEIELMERLYRNSDNWLDELHKRETALFPHRICSRRLSASQVCPRSIISKCAHRSVL